MNKNLLCAALLGGLSLAGAANAQEFDDRWYITGSAGMNIQDNDRDSRNAPFVTLGLGKFINPYWSVDGELNYQNPNRDSNQDLNFSQYGISLDARRHFIAEGRNWNPYLLMGLGYQREEIEFDNFPNPNSPFEDEVGGGSLKLGAGVQGDVGRVKIRTELAYRVNNAIDDSDAALLLDDPAPERNDGPDYFGDLLASVGVVIPLVRSRWPRWHRPRLRRAARTWTTTVTASTTATTSARIRRLARPSVRTAARCRCRST